MNEKIFKNCRTCMRRTPNFKKVTDKCCKGQTIKEVIIFLVPQTLSTVKDEDTVCLLCYSFMEKTIKFIEKCLEVEQTLDEDDNLPVDVKPQEQELIKSIKDLNTSKDKEQNLVAQDHTYFYKTEFVDPLKTEFDPNYEESQQFEVIAMQDGDELNESKDFARAEHLQEPDAYESFETELQFVCVACDEFFESKQLLDAHVNSFHAPPRKTIICEYCGAYFASQMLYMEHCNSTHEAEVEQLTEMYMCDQCPNMFKSQILLHNHIRTVHHKAQCEICDKVFLNREVLKSHYKLVHLEEKPHICDICGIAFGRKDYLKKHIFKHSVDSEEKIAKKKLDGRTCPKRPCKFSIKVKEPIKGKPVKCNICCKTLPDVHLLKVHLQGHVKLKRAKCSHCDLTFTNFKNRDRHERLHLIDPKRRFRCDICWKKIETKEALEEHVASHAKRPPRYNCEHCEEKFHRRYLLDNHMVDKHTEPEDIERSEIEIVYQNLLEYADVSINKDFFQEIDLTNVDFI